MIKSILLSLVITVLVSLSMGTGSAKAYNYFPVCNNGAGGSPVCKDVSGVNGKTKDPVITIIKAVMEVISFIAGAMAVIFIIVSALRFVTSGGSAEDAAKARSTLIYALVGIVVIVLSQSIIAFVLNHVH